MVRDELVQFFNKLAHEHGFHPIKEVNRWYSIKWDDKIIYKDGISIVNRCKDYKNGIIAAYPACLLDIALFEKPRPQSPLIRFFNSLAHNKGYHPQRDPDLWYCVTLSEVLALQGGATILHKFKTYKNAVVCAFPNLLLDKSKFDKSTNWSTNPHAVICFVNKMAHEQGFHPFNEANRWYDVRKADVLSYKGGSRLVHKYKTLRCIVLAAYPDLSLDVAQVDGRVKASQKRAFFDRVAHDKGFHSSQDFACWEDLHMDELMDYKGSFKMFSVFKSLDTALRDTFLDHFTGTPRARQEIVLQNAVRNLFSSCIVICNAKKKSGLTYINSLGKKIHKELDIWIPELNIGFEYQDPYHYTSQFFSHSPLSEIKERDKQKEELMVKMGRTLIVVPCWWDKSLSSLAATIRLQRPDILPEFAGRQDILPISKEPPPGFFFYPNIPGIGELMLAGFVNKDSVYTNWWMGEKFDGIRAFWYSNASIMYSRHGRPLRLCATWYDLLPTACFLDGEIWSGRGNYVCVQHIVNLLVGIEKTKWAIIRFVVFDAPRGGNSLEVFEVRYERVLHTIVRTHPVVAIAPRIKCKSKMHMNLYAKRIISRKGEGVILRQQSSLYEPGRSASLLKFKSVFDREALVKVVDGNRCTCIFPDKSWILASKKTSLVVKQEDIVTIANTYGKKAQNLLFYTITRVRSDITWESVVKNI